MDATTMNTTSHAVVQRAQYEQQQQQQHMVSPPAINATMTPVPSSISPATAVSGLVKKTCEACVRAKIKCNGQTPCERCIKRGIDCMYLAEQKRGRRSLRNSPHSGTSTPTLLPSPPLPSHQLLPAAATTTAKQQPDSKRMHSYFDELNNSSSTFPVFERRMFRIVFSLFKFHRDEKDMTWFAAKFAHLTQLLQLRSAKPNYVSEFTDFLLRHHLITRYPTPAPTASTSAKATLLPSLINLPRLPRMLLHDTTLFYLGAIAAEGNQVRCTPDITQWLGYAEDGRNFPHTRIATTNEVFPWGADVLCSIVEEDSQVLTYLRDVAFAFSEQTPQQQRHFGLYNQISLLDRPITVLVVGSNTVRKLKCLVSCHVRQNEATGNNCAKFDFYLDPNQRAKLLPLPDLELAPWSVDETVMFPSTALVQWASPPPQRKAM